MDSYKGKKVLVAGLGKSGTAAKEALISLGAEVFVRDDNRGYFPAPENKYDMLVLSPGVPPDLEYIQRAAAEGSEIIGELELFYRLSKGSIIAVTGTNGKTTTTALIGEIFKNAGKDTYVVGNIGTAATSVFSVTRDESWLITEASSFQLETIKDFRPCISVILNITPDHLDRHKNMRNYIEAKANVFKNQREDDYFVVNYDNDNAYGLTPECKAKIVPFSCVTELPFGVFVKDGVIVCRDENRELTGICEAGRLFIPGGHNLENALAATAAAYFAGIPVHVIAETLSTFKGVPHRLELCGEIRGVSFINDSKATNPDAAIKAITAVEKPIILIAGGYDKKSEFDEFIGSFGDKVKMMVLLGDTAKDIKEAAEKKGFRNCVIVSDMEECVRTAFESAVWGDAVLLSPACASWDMYDSFEERGEQFKNCVLKLGS